MRYNSSVRRDSRGEQLTPGRASVTTMADESPRARDELRNGFLTGVAVIVPLLITLIVLAIAFNYIYTYLDLFSDVILPFEAQVFVPGVGLIQQEVLVELATPVVLLLLILVVGLTANSSRYGQRAVDYFDYVIERIPGVGSVYESFRQMSDVMLESDDQNFQEVVLVEFPTEGVYTTAFVTSETPETIADPVGRGDMTTLFMPMAPNPVMGGHVVFVPNDRIVEVDMTVEEGIRALVTSGVAVSEATGGEAGIPASQLRGLSTFEEVEGRFDPGSIADEARTADAVAPERAAHYDRAVDPKQARTPDSIAERERPDTGEEDEATGADRGEAGVYDSEEATVTPAERAGRYESAQEETEERPSAAADRAAERRDTTETRPSEAADRAPDRREETERKPSEVAGRDEGDAEEPSDASEEEGNR